MGLFGCQQPGEAQPHTPRPTLDSGGTLPPRQAAYDVRHYDLALAVDPDQRRIDGTLTLRATIVQPISTLELDLDSRFDVRRAGVEAAEAPFESDEGRLRILLPRTYQPGETVTVDVAYGGAPRVAPNPPWDGGFTWAQTNTGAPWIATSVQGQGCDLWWPCKDHPSDEPDSLALRITVPAPLVVATNGVLHRVDEAEGQRTYHWTTQHPVNTYGVALNIAPYVALDTTYASIDGTEMPVTFYVLPEAEAGGRRQLPQFLDHLAFYEEVLGPYPFRTEKYGVAHTPHLGMEHQTIIAYGDDFDDTPYGFDWLHHHELGHEWWGNLVTAADWRDFWIHEGFCTYMQALYTERLFGPERYRAYMATTRTYLQNRRTVAPRTSQTTQDMYFSDTVRGVTDNDVYYKGAWILHTLRYLMGDEPFFQALRRFAYPAPAWEARTGGGQTRFVSSEEFIRLAEELADQPLDWFFDLYLRQPALPLLRTERDGDTLRLRWDTPEALPFPMPVEVQVGGEVVWVEMTGGRGTVTVPEGVTPVIDPDGWVLAER